MTCSPARLAANRANAQKSTGPKTPEGKDRSRKNALKHGLCSAVVVAEDIALIEERTRDWFYPLKPQNELHWWLVDKIAICSLRIDRAERMERLLRDRRSLHAEVAWDDGRMLEVERLGGKLGGSRPAEVSEELRGSTVGCDWLISRWSLLANAADRAAWTPDQITLAFNLLGTPFEFREGRQPGDVLDGRGHVAESSETQSAMARREIDHLEGRRDHVGELDEVDRSLTQADLFDESNPELKRLRRYESALFNRMLWYIKEMRYVSPHFKPCPELTLRMLTNYNAPKPVETLSPMPQPQPQPQPSPSKPKGAYDNWQINSIHPPFDIEPQEVPKDGSRPDLFQILLSRQEKREKKAEARREAKRRRTEKMRA
jgi:hypothetical protein